MNQHSKYWQLGIILTLKEDQLVMILVLKIISEFLFLPLSRKKRFWSQMITFVKLWLVFLWRIDCCSIFCLRELILRQILIKWNTWRRNQHNYAQTSLYSHDHLGTINIFCQCKWRKERDTRVNSKSTPSQPK